jgi:hypothetical protein
MSLHLLLADLFVLAGYFAPVHDLDLDADPVGPTPLVVGRAWPERHHVDRVVHSDHLADELMPRLYLVPMRSEFSTLWRTPYAFFLRTCCPGFARRRVPRRGRTPPSTLVAVPAN